MNLKFHTIRFSKDYFFNFESCVEWLEKNSFQNISYEEVETFYVYNQAALDKFNEASLQEMTLGSGVVGVVGIAIDADDTLANVNDADLIVPGSVVTGAPATELEAADVEKTKLLAELSDVFESIKGFIAKGETKEVATTLVSKDDDNKGGVSLQVPIIKKTAERIVFGEVLVPDTFDGQNHIYSELEVEKAAHYWMKEFQQMGEMHKKMLEDKQSTVLESYVAPVTFNLGDKEVKKGTWLLKMYVEDDDLWEKIDGGDYTGFSIQGLADAETLDDGE